MLGRLSKQVVQETEMTEAEAIALVKVQFGSETGFIARLSHEGYLDRSALDKVLNALDTLSAAWRDRDVIPKDVALSLVDTISPLHAAAESNPSLEDEIEDIADDLNTRLDRLFYDRSNSMSEAEAMAIVKAQLSGMQSMVITLHQRGGLIRTALKEVQEALDVLQRSWSARTNVPRSIVGPMLDVRNAILSNSGWYPPEFRAELEVIADDLRDRVKRCLS
jgi:hypothetical protein